MDSCDVGETNATGKGGSEEPAGLDDGKTAWGIATKTQKNPPQQGGRPATTNKCYPNRDKVDVQLI